MPDQPDDKLHNFEPIGPTVSYTYYPGIGIAYHYLDPISGDHLDDCPGCADYINNPTNEPGAGR